MYGILESLVDSIHVRGYTGFKNLIKAKSDRFD